jgi:uncharacterized membrane protein YhaH (DUF805 family)
MMDACAFGREEYWIVWSTQAMLGAVMLILKVKSHYQIEDWYTPRDLIEEL